MRRAVAAAVLVVATTGKLVHATDYNWKNDASGNWIDAGVWLPAGTPNATTDNATIAIGGVPYTVTLNSNITVNTLTLNSSVATLSQTSGLFTFNTATLDAGTYTLNGGTMSGGTINEAGGTLNIQSGTLSNVSITGNDLNDTSILHIAGTIAIAGSHNLNLSANSNLFFSGQSVDNLNITPAGNSTIFTEGNSNTAATLTLGTGVVVHGGASFSTYNGGDGLINNGLINGDKSTNATNINLSSFTNNGTLEASNGGSLNINPGSWTNAGTLLASGGTLNLGGNFTNTGTFNGSAGTISIVGGTFTNTSSTVTLNSATGNLFLNGGTISGGTIAEAASGLGTLNVQSGTLSNVSITGNDLNDTSTLHIAGTIAIAGSHNLNLSANSNLFFSGQSVDNLNITPAGNSTIFTEGNPSTAATLTLGTGVVVHGGASFSTYNGGDGLINNGLINGDKSTNATNINLSSLTNNGTLEASNGGSLNINPGSWTNAGTLLASGGTLNLGGNFTNTGTFNGSAGTISIVGGTFTNTSSTVTLNSATGNLFLNGGTISGGTIAEAASGLGTLNVQSGTLSNVSITGNDLNDTSILHIAGTIAIAGSHNLNLSANSNLFFSGQSVDNLNITPAGNSTIFTEGNSNTAATLTLGTGVVVHGGASFSTYNGGDGLINNGLINGDKSTNATNINLSSFTNNGTLEASNGGSLNINPGSWTNAGTLLASGGTLNLGGNFTNTGTFNGSAGTISIVGGTFTNTSSTVTLNSATGNLFLNGGTISGGTIAEAASGLGTLNVQSGTLSNVSITGNDLNDTSTLHIAGTIAIAGSHNLNLSANSNLFFSGQSVDNLNITPAGNSTIFTEGNPSTAATLTLGTGVVVHGGASFSTYNGGDGLINNGLINGDKSTNATNINLSSLTNNGTLEASNGGSLNINPGSWTNAGTLLASGGTLNLGGNFTNTGTFNGSAGTISIVGGTFTNTSSTVTLNSATGNLFLNGGTISGGTIAEAASGLGTLNVQSGTLSNVSITGNDLNDTSTLHIAGTIAIAGSHNLNLSANSNLFFSGQSVDNLNITPAGNSTIFTEGNPSTAATLTLGTGVVVHGGASFSTYNGGDGLINNGLINGDKSTNATNINLSSFTNNGTLEASNGGSLNFNSSTAFTNNGRIYLSNGTISDSTILSIGSGSLGGSGTVNATVSLVTSSSFVFNIGGATKGSGYDSLLINGNLSLGGSLRLYLINGFKPTANQTFTIVTLGNGDLISGAFANVANGGVLNTADGMGSFTVNDIGSQILLSNFQPAPEPASGAVLGFGAIGLLRRRRRSVKTQG